MQTCAGHGRLIPISYLFACVCVFLCCYLDTYTNKTTEMHKFTHNTSICVTVVRCLPLDERTWFVCSNITYYKAMLKLFVYATMWCWCVLSACVLLLIFFRQAQMIYILLHSHQEVEKKAAVQQVCWVFFVCVCVCIVDLERKVMFFCCCCLLLSVVLASSNNCGPAPQPINWSWCWWAGFPQPSGRCAN